MFWDGLKKRGLLTLIVAVALGCSAAPATAGKPAWAGGDKHKQGQSHKAAKKEARDKKNDKQSAKSKGGGHGKYFGDDDRVLVRDYFDSASRKGKGCPPGLAKKNNGCMPPGQAKKRWAYGRPLSREVVFHDLPRQLARELPAPPAGSRYVRVVSDILLIAIGTGIVLDAIEDLREI